MFIQIFW